MPGSLKYLHLFRSGPAGRKSNGDYRVRFLSCLAASLLLVLTAVRLWPPPSGKTYALAYSVRPQEVIEIDEIQPTRQSNQKPPPPAPPIPLVVPNETVLEDVELDLSDNLSVERPEVGEAPEPGPVVERSPGPTVGPKTVRFVEPEYTREARRKRVRAELVLKVLVDEKGKVRETEILERFLLDRDGGEKTPVDVLGYGLEEAAIAAAERWVFRPARRDGRPVAAYTTLTFTFGV